MITSQNSKRALITGIQGQDGSYLSELLRQQGYIVGGIVHKESFKQKDHFYCLDLRENPGGLYEVIKDFAPSEIYHLAAHHHSSEQGTGYIREYFDNMIQVNFETTKVIAESILDICPSTRFFYAGSSQMFTPQPGQTINEQTPFSPSTPYGLTKVLSAELIRYLRKAYNLWASVGILFNHESPRRSNTFVTKMIAEGVAQIKTGTNKRLTIKNIGAVADWSHAKDFVKGMHLALTAPSPQDYVFASGALNSVENILEIAFERVGLNWRDYVDFSQNLPTQIFQGDPTRAKSQLGWQPTFDLRSVIEEMVDTEVKRLNSN